MIPSGTFRNTHCLSLLETVSRLIEKWQLSAGCSSNLLRIVISSFGSPFWQFDQRNLSTDLTTTLMLLKSLVRSANAVAVVTVPHHLLDVTFHFPLRIKSINITVNLIHAFTRFDDDDDDV